MIGDVEPNLVNSGKSQRTVIDGYSSSIQNYRLEDDNAWTLEVVDCDGSSHVWDVQFISD